MASSAARIISQPTKCKLCPHHTKTFCAENVPWLRVMIHFITSFAITLLHRPTQEHCMRLMSAGQSRPLEVLALPLKLSPALTLGPWELPDQTLACGCCSSPSFSLLHFIFLGGGDSDAPRHHRVWLGHCSSYKQRHLYSPSFT